MKHLDGISETFDLELKAWLDPANGKDAALIARTCIALRNNNGGKLILGFEDKTTKQLAAPAQVELRTRYNADAIQQIVSRYALPIFDVEVVFEEKDGIEHPIVLVKAGVQSPVITRSAYEKELRQNTVYMRCLSNGTVSSAEPKTPQDWDRLIRICFDNREADIARFFARHLSLINTALQTFPSGPISLQVLEDGFKAFHEKWAEMKEKNLAPATHHGFREVAFWIDGPVQHFSLARFLNHVFAHQPHYTGWPSWFNSSGQRIEEFRPYTSKGGWESFVVRSWHHDQEINFWRTEPRGRFYDLRMHEDDTAEELLKRDVPPGTALDFLLVIARAAEHIGMAKAFAEALVTTPDDVKLEFTFRWTGLKSRNICCWVEPSRGFSSAKPAHDDSATSTIGMPLNTPPTGLWRFVKKATEPLFEVFGVDVGDPVVEELSNRTLTRRH